MIFSKKHALNAMFARPMLASALALGTVGAVGLLGSGLVATPAMAKDAQPKYSDKFIAAAGPLQNALAKQQGKPADAAAIASLRKQLDAATAAATTDDDKYLAGRFAVNVGSLAQDTALESKGVHEMLDSGKTPAADAAKYHAALAQWAYQAKDYATTQSELKLAIAAGNNSADLLTMMAEAQFAAGQTADGIASLQQAIDRQKASGQPVSSDWYERGIQVAYKAKLLSQSANLAAQLVADYPNSKNWMLAIDTLRDAAQYAPREMLDLLRLMGRTDSYSDGNDYLIYVDDLDPHRLPGEAEKVLDAGIASGKLKAGNVSVDDSLHIVKSRVAADRASLPTLSRDAHAANADTHLILVAGDVFLGYGEAVKAEELFNLALTKPGVDANLANTRLGIAQCDAGDYAGAQATFAKITGPRADLAKLWIIYAKQKAAGK